MALNPPLTSEGLPCRVNGEYFIMNRGGVSFEMKVKKGNKYSGKGEVILTTCRLVCVNSDTKSLFKSFDLPLALIYSEKFTQPIFGSNYLGGYCKPLMNILPGDVEFYIYFTEGGVGTFIPSVMSIIANVRKNNNKGPDEKMLNNISTGIFAKTAYIDPNDPSKIYLEQPKQEKKVNNIEVKNTDREDNDRNKFNINSIDNNNNFNNNINKNNFETNNGNFNNNFNNFSNFNNQYNNNNNNSDQRFITNSNQINDSNIKITNNENQNFNSNMTNNNYNNNFTNFNNNTEYKYNNTSSEFNHSSNNQQNFNNNSNLNQFTNIRDTINNNNGVNDFNHINNEEIEYPSLSDLQTNNSNTAENINNNVNRNNQNNPKYFYFFGPELQKKNN